MLYFNYFNSNIGFNFGMNNLFSPINSLFAGFNGFGMCNWFSNPMNGFSMFNPGNFWNGGSFNFNNIGFSNNIFSGMNFGSFWDNSIMFNNVSSNSIWSNSYSNVTRTSDSFESTTSKPTTAIIDGYNAVNGKKLAVAAWNGRNTKKVWKNGKWTYFTGYCCRYVKTALKKTGLAPYYDGHAYQMISNLRTNKNFKEIAVTDENYKNLPAGCILVYGKGVRGYSREYGHVEIVTENGKAVSDGVTENRRKPSAIFIPV